MAPDSALAKSEASIEVTYIYLLADAITWTSIRFALISAGRMAL